MEDRAWKLTVTWPPVVDQGWEEQSPEQDWASLVLAEVKRVWEFDDEVSNDYKGEGFEGDTRWTMTEDRTEMVFYCDILDAMMVPLEAIMMRSIPATMLLEQL